MKIIPKFICKLIGGKLEFTNRQKLINYLKSLPENIELELVIKKKTSQRSLEQNAWYWGIALKTILKEVGYSPKEMHEILKAEFLTSFWEFQGKAYTIVRSTTDLNTTEFSEYMGNVQRFASMEMGVYIPSPNEVDYSQLIYNKHD
ncbi:MAG: recombination protein NinB [Candidatus Paceibacterota bacterium]